MLNYIKGDFRYVKDALEFMVGRKIPIGIFVLYYVIVGLITLPLIPFIWLGAKIYVWYMIKKIEKLGKEA